MFGNLTFNGDRLSIRTLISATLPPITLYRIPSNILAIRAASSSRIAL